MSQNDVERFRKRFPVMPLVQTPDLRAAKKIGNLEGIEVRELERLRQMGRVLFEAYPNLLMVAFNQFEEAAFGYFGADPNLKNIVYLAPDVEDLNRTLYLTKSESGRMRFISLAGSILLNVEVKHGPKVLKFIHPEGCGSIGRSRYSMLTARDQVVDVSAFVYNPDINYRRPTWLGDINNGRSGTAGIQHESDHLLGKDAVSSPRTKLLDPWIFDDDDWKGHQQSEWLRWIDDLEDVNEWLITRGGEVVVADRRGKKIKTFKKEDYYR